MIGSPTGATNNTASMLQSSALPQALQTWDPLISGIESRYPQDDALGDFLAEIMMPISPGNLAPSIDNAGGPMGTRDVLDFGIDETLDFGDLDLGLLMAYDSTVFLPPQADAVEDSSYPPSRGEDSQELAVGKLSIEAFQRSLWRWHPGKADHAQGESMNLSLPGDVRVIAAHRPCKERLGQSARDKIMSMLFSTCDQVVISKIIPQFPSVEILDNLMQQFFHLHSSRSDSFVHVSTFQTNSVKTELLAMAIATGAVNNPNPIIRKLGFALQEAARLFFIKNVAPYPSIPQWHARWLTHLV